MGPRVVLLHGIGLGAWLWERFQPFLSEAGLESHALDLPGHGAKAGENASLEAVVEAVVAFVRRLEAPVAVVGHSMGGFAAQVVATRLPLSHLVLMAPTPPPQVPWLPSRRILQAGVGVLPSLVAGRSLVWPREIIDITGPVRMEADERERAHTRNVPWPNALCRDLAFRRPAIDRGTLTCPVMVMLGRDDPIIPVETGRLTGAFYGGTTRCYDQLRHYIPLEPGWERAARDLVSFLTGDESGRDRGIQAFAPSRIRGMMGARNLPSSR